MQWNLSESYPSANNTSIWTACVTWRCTPGCCPRVCKSSLRKTKVKEQELVPKYKTQTAQRLSPVHSIATEWNKLDKTLKNYILDMPITFETKKKKLKFYYLHIRDSEEVKTMLENCKTCVCLKFVCLESCWLVRGRVALASQQLNYNPLN